MTKYLSSLFFSPNQFGFNPKLRQLIVWWGSLSHQSFVISYARIGCRLSPVKYSWNFVSPANFPGIFSTQSSTAIFFNLFDYFRSSIYVISINNAVFRSTTVWSISENDLILLDFWTIIFEAIKLCNYLTMFSWITK